MLDRKSDSNNSNNTQQPYIQSTHPAPTDFTVSSPDPTAVSSYSGTTASAPVTSNLGPQFPSSSQDQTHFAISSRAVVRNKPEELPTSSTISMRKPDGLSQSHSTATNRNLVNRAAVDTTRTDSSIGDIPPSVVMPAVEELQTGRVSPRSQLHVVQKPRRTTSTGSRRAFQPRRRGRACDQCRTRKTKCDTPDNGSCSSCAAASLECHFSEGGDERRRAGPTRRLRAYELLTRDLFQKLDRANAMLASAGLPTVQSVVPQGEVSVSSSPTSMSPNLAKIGDLTNYMDTSTPNATSEKAINDRQDFASQPQQAAASTARQSPPNILTQQLFNLDRSATYPLFRNSRRATDDLAIYDGQFYGSSSCASFAETYREYLQRMGFVTPSIFSRNSSKPQNSSQMQWNRSNETVPDSSKPDLPPRWPLPSAEESLYELDLRSLLPTREEAEECKEVYRTTMQKYFPIFYWPEFEEKWARAWNQPIMERDKAAVRTVFCVVVMMLAVSCQMIEGWKGNKAGTEERQGWVYFLIAKHFHDEYPPTYDIEDATIFLLMSVYLMNASLPSPSWMTIGATCRVFQDLGLHKMPKEGQISDREQEIRNRMFWAAYVLDRQIAIVFGRPVIFQDEDINVKLPGMLDKEGVGLGPDMEETDKHAREYKDKGDHQPGIVWSSDMSLKVYRGLVEVCRCFESVRSSFAQEGGSDRDIMHVKEIENQLDLAWQTFPPEITNIDAKEPLEIAALEPILDAQHARLLLYRSFTDFRRTLTSAWRTFCFTQSIRTCKISARLLLRCAKLPHWETEFALISNETVRVHSFRSAALLLLGYNMNSYDPSFERVEREELMICIQAVKASAERHHSMKKPMQMIEALAKMFNINISDIQGPLERQGNDESRRDTVSIDHQTIHSDSPAEQMEWTGGDNSDNNDKQHINQSSSVQDSYYPMVGSIPKLMNPSQCRDSSDYVQDAQLLPPNMVYSQQPGVSYFSNDPSPSPYPSSGQMSQTYDMGGSLRLPAVTLGTPVSSPNSVPITPSVVPSLDGLMLSPALGTPTSAPSAQMPPPRPVLPELIPMQPLPGPHQPRANKQRRRTNSHRDIQYHQQKHQQQQQQQNTFSMYDMSGAEKSLTSNPLLNQPYQYTLDLGSQQSGINWDAFQAMMLADNQCFSELLASGPEVSWGYMQHPGMGSNEMELSSLEERGGYGGGPMTAAEERQNGDSQMTSIEQEHAQERDNERENERYRVKNNGRC